MAQAVGCVHILGQSTIHRPRIRQGRDVGSCPVAPSASPIDCTLDKQIALMIQSQRKGARSGRSRTTRSLIGHPVCQRRHRPGPKPASGTLNRALWVVARVRSSTLPAKRFMRVPSCVHMLRHEWCFSSLVPGSGLGQESRGS